MDQRREADLKKMEQELRLWKRKSTKERTRIATFLCEKIGDRVHGDATVRSRIFYGLVDGCMVPEDFSWGKDYLGRVPYPL